MIEGVKLMKINQEPIVIQKKIPESGQINARFRMLHYFFSKLHGNSVK